MATSLRPTSVDLAGLMRVLGEALYSTPAVAIRELIQNAHDSYRRRALESDAVETPRIVVDCDRNAGTIIVEDRGAGLTDDEIEQYLARVGSGYTRHLRDEGVGDELIGYFGLGFLSAHVIAERTRVWTCSYQTPEQSWTFETRGGQSYSLRPGETREVGTRVQLHLRPEHAHLAEPKTLRALTTRYCALLGIEVEVCGTSINPTPPPWRNPTLDHPAREHRERLDFVRRFEPSFEPICCIPVPGPANARGGGLIWIQDGASYATSDNRRVSVFVRGMSISHDERDLLPAWAGFCGAVIEDDGLSPTASRESLQEDDAHADCQARIRDALISGLVDLAAQHPDTWQRIRERHGEALLGASLSEERLFDALSERLCVPTSEGDCTPQALVRRGQAAIYLGQGERRGAQEILFRALKRPIVDSTRYAAAAFCRAYANRHGVEIVALGTRSGDRKLFGPPEVGSDARAALESAFARESYDVKLSSFDPAFLPFVVVIDEDKRIKERIESQDAERRISSALLGLARLHTAQTKRGLPRRLYVNTRCPVIRRIGNQRDEQLRVAMVALMFPLVMSMIDSDGDRDGEGLQIAFEGLDPAIARLLEGQSGPEDRH